jgi:hypothetical protein
MKAVHHHITKIILKSALLDLFGFNCLLLSFLSQFCLVSEDTTTPFSSKTETVVVLSSEVLDQVFQVSLVLKKFKKENIFYLLSDASQGNAGSSALVNELAESCLVLDETESDFLLSAELREPDDGFDGVNVVGNNDQSSLLFFNKSGNVIESELDFVGGGLNSWLSL